MSRHRVDKEIRMRQKREDTVVLEEDFITIFVVQTVPFCTTAKDITKSMAIAKFRPLR